MLYLPLGEPLADRWGSHALTTELTTEQPDAMQSWFNMLMNNLRVSGSPLGITNRGELYEWRREWQSRWCRNAIEVVTGQVWPWILKSLMTVPWRNGSVLDALRQIRIWVTLASATLLNEISVRERPQEASKCENMVVNSPHWRNPKKATQQAALMSASMYCPKKPLFIMSMKEDSILKVIGNLGRVVCGSQFLMPRRICWSCNMGTLLILKGSPNPPLI